MTTQGGRGRGVDPRQRQGSHSWRTWGRRCGRRWTNLRRRGCWHGGLIWRHGGGEGGRMGGGGGGLAHASRLASEEPKISRRRDSRAEGRGSAPGLMPRGFLPRGKRRDAGCNSTSRRLPNVAINLPGGACPADFSPGEITGNPTGFGASKLALNVKRWNEHETGDLDGRAPPLETSRE